MVNCHVSASVLLFLSDDITDISKNKISLTLVFALLPAPGEYEEPDTSVPDL